MADKLLILGAAIAHQNKSYNIGSSIAKAVDSSVKDWTAEVEARRKRIGAASLLTQQYLDKLPENPEIDLLDENISGMFTTDLSNIRNNIATRKMDMFANSYKYAPGTQAYTDGNNEIKRLEKQLKTRLKDAQDIQLAKSNWIKEHANISDTWKLFNADKYEALTRILQKDNPTYTAKRNKDDELILSTTIASGETIDVNVSELDDWEEFPMPEINKINAFYELAQNAGAQGKDLPDGTVVQIQNYLYNYIGKNKNALLSLMFDKLPIGDPDNRMGYFTETELHEMFDTDDSGDLSSEEMSVFGKKGTEYDFSNMRTKVIDKIVEKIKLENENHKPEEAGYFNDPNESSTERNRRTRMANNTTSFVNLLKDSQNKTVDEIMEIIKKDSYFSAFISNEESKGTIIMPDKSSITDMAVDAFNIKPQIEIFKTGNILPLLERLMRKLGSTKANRDAVNTDVYYYNQLDEDHFLKQVQGKLNPGKK